jgi:hypothetical protein
MHHAQSRAQAAFLVPLFLVWGVSALAAANQFRAPKLVWIVSIAVVVRVILVGTPPLLSDDLYRYLWEGWVLAKGHNPYVQSPTDLAHLGPLSGRVNNPQLVSIYPPGAMTWFRAMAAIGQTALVAQVFAVVADLAVTVAVAVACPQAGLLYALHPLPVLESANGGHVEALAVAATAWTARSMLASRHAWAGFTLGVGISAKFFPALLLPSALRLAPARVSGGAIFGVILLSLPVAHTVPGAVADGLSSFQVYAGQWAFNGLLYPWLTPVLGAQGARLLLLALGGVAVAAAARLPFLHAWRTVGAAFVFLSPTVHPWYLLWVLVPDLMLGQRGWAGGAVLYLGAYGVLRGLDSSGAWLVGPELWWLTWPPLLLAVLAGRRSEPWHTAP